MSKCYISRVITAAGFLAAALQLPAHAQSVPVRDLGNGIQGAAALDIAYSYSDNFFYQSTNTESADGYFLRPNLQLSRNNETLTYRFRAAAEYAVYDLPASRSNYQDEYLDANAGLGFDWKAGARHLFSFDTDFRRDHDPLGFNTALTNTNIPVDADEYRDNRYATVYRFGAREALLNLEFRASTRDRSYTNNDANTQFLNYRNDNFGGTAFVNVSPKTAILFDLHLSTVEFDVRAPGTAENGNTETRYRTGIQWKATAKTTGDIRVGYSTVDYDIGRERNRLNWVGSVVWSPASRTSFTLATGRSNQETYLATQAINALSIENDDYAVEWAQRWGSRVQTTLASRFVRADFIGYTQAGQSERVDEVSSIAFTLEYTVARFLSVIGSLSQSDRDSSVALNNYRANINYIGIRLTPP